MHPGNMSLNAIHISRKSGLIPFADLTDVREHSLLVAISVHAGRNNRVSTFLTRKLGVLGAEHLVETTEQLRVYALVNNRSYLGLDFTYLWVGIVAVCPLPGFDRSATLRSRRLSKWIVAQITLIKRFRFIPSTLVIIVISLFSY